MTPTNPLIPDGSVIITPSDMFSELRATHDEVKNLSLKLESLTDTVGGRVSIIEKVVADHETRIRALERKLWAYAGGLTVAAGVISYVASHLPAW